jgi:hypothetical protein
MARNEVLKNALAWSRVVLKPSVIAAWLSPRTVPHALAEEESHP